MNFLNKKCLFVIDIGIEDLPYNKFKYINNSFLKDYKNNLYKNNIFFNKINIFFSSRRISIISKKLYKLNNYIYFIIRGPSLNNLFNINNYLILNKWINKYNLNLYKVKYLITDDGIWFIYFVKNNKKINIKKTLFKVVNDSIIDLLKNNSNFILSNDIKFIKPITNITLILNNIFIFGSILDIKLSNFIYGNINKIYEKIYIHNSNKYISYLKKYGKVIINSDYRKKIILNKIYIILEKYNLYTKDKYINDNIDMYSFLNEYPSVLCSEFNILFINLPEIFIEYIMDYYKYIPTFNKINNKISNKFILISNLITKKYNNFIYWNTFNINNSLNEISILFNIDIKNIFFFKNEFKKIIFRKKIGTIYNKTNRVKKIILYINNKTIKYNIINYIENLINLYKIDLITNLGIFYPKLCEIINYSYYLNINKTNNFILNNKKNINIIDKYIFNKLNNIIYIIILSDKLDTLVGNFILCEFYKYKVTGNNDPLYIKKYSIFIINFLINFNYNIKISSLINKSLLIYNEKDNNYFLTKIKKFFINRIISFYLNKNYSIDIINSVIYCQNDIFYDIDIRIKSIKKFIQCKDKIINIINTYKRINNLIINNIFNIKRNINYIYIYNKNINEIKKIENYLNINIKNKNYLNSLYILNIMCKKINIYLNNTLILTDNTFIKNYRLKFLNDIINNFYKIINFNLLKIYE